MTQTFRVIAMFLCAFLTMRAGENLGGIYLGENVGSLAGPQDIAVRILPNGVVTIYLGAIVPGLHDKDGREVRVKSVRTEKATPLPPVAPPAVSSLAEAAKIAAARWGVSIPVRGIRYGVTGAACTGGTTAQAALTDFATRIITVNSACSWDQGVESDRLLAAVLTHEFGHLLMGPDHSSDPHSIMFSSVNPDQIVTPDDRARLAAWEAPANLPR